MSDGGAQERWVIHFSADPAEVWNRQVRHHLCLALSKQFKVLWVNPYGFRWPRLNRRVLRVILRKMMGWTKGPRPCAEGWIAVTPLMLPVFTESPLQRANKLLISRQMSAWARRYQITRAILFFTTPRYASAATLYPQWPAITYFSDAYSRHRELSSAEQRRMRSEEDTLLAQSRRVLACSLPLYRELQQRTDSAKVIHFPHQVNVSLFSGARAETAMPAEMRCFKRPIVGYYGTLTDSNDWVTLRFAAERRPGYTFILIGKKEISRTGLESLPNVHFIGPRPYDQIPSYGRCFDVAVMFWVVRDWIRYCSPLKLREYLAMGVPVVSTWIEDVAESFGDVVSVTKTPEEFLNALDRAVQEPNPLAIEKGRERVASDSWDKIIPLFEGVWNEAFGELFQG